MAIYSDKITLDGEDYISASIGDHILRLSYGQVAIFCREKKIPAIKYFGKWFIKKTDWNAFVESCKHGNWEQ